MFPIASTPSAVDIHKSIHKGRAPQLYAAAITTYALAVITVALRFWARRLGNGKIWVDDWTVTAALFVTTGYLVNVIVSLHQGFGEHYELLIHNCAITFGKNLFSEQLLYFAVIGLAKISILAFYWRVFKTSKPVRISCYSLGVIVACWEMAALLVTVLQCRPISGYWNKEIHSKCIDEKHFFLGYSIPNILTDIALLLVPISSIWSLQMRISHKIGVIGTFMLGSLVTVISIIRLVILLQPNSKCTDVDFDYNYVSLSGWSIAESNMAIVAACLPSLRPLFSHIFHSQSRPSARSPSDDTFSRSEIRRNPSAMVQSHQRSTSVSESQQDLRDSTDDVQDFSGMKSSCEATIRTQKDRNSRDSEDLEMQRDSKRIHLTHDVDVTFEQKQNERRLVN
ncbi:hypothetical protein BDR22DRAFT_852571 [Usnea florida]